MTTANKTNHNSMKNKTVIEKPNMTCMEARDEAVTAMLVKWPWYGHFCMALNAVETPQVPIAACGWDPKTGAGTLYFHPQNFQKFDMKTRIFFMAHEITHWTNLHTHSNFHGDLVNIAMDMSVNSTLKQMGLEPTHPEEFITIDGTWHKYAQLEPGLKRPQDAQSWEYYFNWLLDRKKNIQNKLEKLLQQLGLQLGDQGDGDALAEGIAPGMGDLLTDHDGWGDLSEAEKELVKQYVANHAERTSNTVRPPGQIAGNIEALIESCKPKVDWRRYLKNWAGTTGSLDIDTTRSRLNKYGGTPRITLRPRAALCVVQDTSGSVGDEELAQFWGEIESMVRTLNLDLWVMQVDHAVHSCNKFKFRPDHTYDVKGRGGTDMTLAFDYLNEPKNKPPRVSGVIVMTDGYTPFPEPRELQGRKCLWVITQKEMVKQVPDGIGPAIFLDTTQKKGE